MGRDGREKEEAQKVYRKLVRAGFAA